MTNRTKITGITVGKLFKSTITNISEVREQLDFTGAIDVGVTLNTTLEDKTGFLLVPFKGNDTNRSNIELKLATRIHLSEIEKQITYVYEGELKFDDKGPKVKALQRKLNQLLNLSLKVDGEYGYNTTNAVRAFTCLKGLKPTGDLKKVVGMKLMETLSL